MRSQFAGLRTLVLPSGALTGPRTIISGVDGTITVYDASNAVRFRVGVPAGTMELGTGDVAETSLGDIQTLVLGSGATRRPEIVIETPALSNQDKAIIEMIGENQGGTLGPFIGLTADVIGFDSVSGHTVLSVDNNPIGYGLVVPPFRDTTNDAAVAAGNSTDMTISPGIKGERVYGIHLHSQALFAAAGAYAIELDYEGTVIGRFDRRTAAAGDVDFIDSMFVWEPSADDGTATLTVINGSGSAGNLTMQATGTNSRTLAIYDLGQQ